MFTAEAHQIERALAEGYLAEQILPATDKNDSLIGVSGEAADHSITFEGESDATTTHPNMSLSLSSLLGGRETDRKGGCKTRSHPFPIMILTPCPGPTITSCLFTVLAMPQWTRHCSPSFCSSSSSSWLILLQSRHLQAGSPSIECLIVPPPRCPLPHQPTHVAACCET